MKILVIDDEDLARRMLISAIREACPDAQIYDFSRVSDLLKFAETTTCELAFCDIHLRGVTGIELAKKLKSFQPKINIIFVTGYDNYTAEAMFMRASGYVMKPATKEKILEEIKELRYPVQPKKESLLQVKCFGNFDVFTPTGEPVKFYRAKAKEMFAYLVYKKGARCTIRELSAVLLDEGVDTQGKMSYMRSIVAYLLKSLEDVKADKVVIKERNMIAIDVKLIDCDAYRFEEGDVSAINSYLGEYMYQYEWAEFASEYYNKKFR